MIYNDKNKDQVKYFYKTTDGNYIKGIKNVS